MLDARRWDLCIQINVSCARRWRVRRHRKGAVHQLDKHSPFCRRSLGRLSNISKNIMTGGRIFSRRAIEDLIANGDTIVLHQNAVLRLNAWQHIHSGGRLVIQHMVGRDATDELSMYVVLYSSTNTRFPDVRQSLLVILLTRVFLRSHAPEIICSMSRYCIGRFEGDWTNFTPPLQGGTFRRDHKSLSLDSATLCRPEPVTPLSEASHLDATPGSYTAGAIQEELNADIQKYPPLDASTQRNIALKFRELHQRVRDEGYYDCRYLEYGKEMGRYVALFCLFLFFLKREWYTVSACSLGLWWHQIMFTAHDAGHRGITHNFIIDSLIEILIGNFCSGLSIGWWKSSHNIHHFVTNDPVSASYNQSCRYDIAAVRTNLASDAASTPRMMLSRFGRGIWQA